MTTFSGAFDAVKARLNAVGSGITIPLRYMGDQQAPVPDTPSAFAFVMAIALRGEMVGVGGGRGGNIYRTPVLIEAYVFSPSDEGLSANTDAAETIAARMRSFRDADISCFAATVHPVGDGETLRPPGLASAVSNYQCSVVEIELHFDQVG